MSDSTTSERDAEALYEGFWKREPTDRGHAPEPFSQCSHSIRSMWIGIAEHARALLYTAHPASQARTEPGEKDHPTTADRTHVPELEPRAYNQKPKTNDHLDAKLYRYGETDLYQWWSVGRTSVFAEPVDEPFVIASRSPPPPAEAQARVEALESVHLSDDGLTLSIVLPGSGGFYSWRAAAASEIAPKIAEGFRALLSPSTPKPASAPNAEDYPPITIEVQARVGIAETKEEAWSELCEVDDRNSPEEYPDMCLITQDELFGFMDAAVDAALNPTPQTNAGSE
jgi:hypothetical protein